MDPSKRFVTMVLAAGVLVLLAAIAIGNRMGDRVLGQAADSGPAAMPLITPAPTITTAPYGPDWKRAQTLAAAPDPGFPDPRIPPKPLPTLQPTPTPSPRHATPTPNPNIPIWDQRPFPSLSPSAGPQGSAGPTSSASPHAPAPTPSETPQP